MIQCACDGCGKRIVGNRREIQCGICGHVQDMEACGGLLKGSLSPSSATPVEKWPWWARKVRNRRREGEKGVGDTLERLIALGGGRKIKALVKMAGMDCGCDARQETLNSLYKY